MCAFDTNLPSPVSIASSLHRLLTQEIVCCKYGGILNPEHLVYVRFRSSKDGIASWHCCYAPCPPANHSGLSAIVAAVCLSNGAELSLNVLQLAAESKYSDKTKSTAAQSPSTPTPPFSTARQNLHNPSEAGFIEQTAPQPCADIPAAPIKATAAGSIAQLIMAEVQQVRAAAAAAAGQELTTPCRVTVQRLGSMHEAEVAAWEHVCSSLRHSPAAATDVGCKLVSELLVACCSEDTPCRQDFVSAFPVKHSLNASLQCHCVCASLMG